MINKIVTFEKREETPTTELDNKMREEKRILKNMGVFSTLKGLIPWLSHIMQWMSNWIYKSQFHGEERKKERKKLMQIKLLTEIFKDSCWTNSRKKIVVRLRSLQLPAWHFKQVCERAETIHRALNTKHSPDLIFSQKEEMWKQPPMYNYYIHKIPQLNCGGLGDLHCHLLSLEHINICT